MTDRITAKVARINSDRELILNAGSAQGIEVGMNFRIKGDAIPVHDPVTNEELGSVAPIKVAVEIAEVAEKFSIARTFRSRTVNIGGSGSGLGSLAGMLQPPKYETRVETLRRNPNAGEPIPESQSVVSVGDDAEQVLDGEDYGIRTATTLWQ